ncbi:MAG: enoyl-CoA hydratase/isomerase family protein, partial [Thermodesulfobacteriota bacterium]
ELVLLNRPLSAKEAMDFGLVNVVLPEEGFLERVKGFGLDLVKGPSRAFGDCKKLLRLGLMEPLETQMEHERRMIMRHSLDQEFFEGLRAFAERRKPMFP